ncbi:hypothetical protein FBU59_004105 [Linderina macrospora]|uniref:Uncharacterized protein n=1 Tax=Linderina macrospora TaxID=4868 RepID=A0ACC1J6H0_9FUNG|nr:hypothetical protein FBU59_004105 [Linderina macrospora]
MSYNATPPSNSSVLHRKKYTHYPPSVPVRFYDCDECSDRFDGYHKLKRHRVGHMDMLQTKFNGDVVLEFPITPEKRVLCRCNKTVTISTMLNSHKYRCEACITEASDKLNRQETPPSPVQAPVKKSDINFILNPIESVPSLSSTVSTSSTAVSKLTTL